MSNSTGVPVTFDTLSKWKSTQIARTEIVRASARGSLSAYAELDVEKFNLKTSQGACPICKNAEANNSYLVLYPQEGRLPRHPSPRSLLLNSGSGGFATLVCLVVDAKDSDPWGYNPILKDGERIGMTSSGGYGHRVEKSIALGYVTPEFAALGTKMDVEILGRARSAEVVAMPLYDQPGSGSYIVF